MLLRCCTCLFAGACTTTFTCLCWACSRVRYLACTCEILHMCWAREALLACVRSTQMVTSLVDVWLFVQPFLCAAHPGSVGTATCSWLTGPLWLGAVGSALRLNAASWAHWYSPHLPEIVVAFRIEHGRICKLTRLFTRLYGSDFRTKPWCRDLARFSPSFPRGPGNAFAKHVAEADAAVERAVAGHKLAWLRPGHGSGSSSGSDCD